jgi:hypothetical protein
MGTELLSEDMLVLTLVLMQMTFLNNVRNVGRLVLSRTYCQPLSIFCFHGSNSRKTSFAHVCYHKGK